MVVVALTTASAIEAVARMRVPLSYSLPISIENRISNCRFAVVDI